MELVNLNTTFSYNNHRDKTIQETIIENEEPTYVVVNISLRDMK